jgi:flagellar FliJ protein
MFRFRLQRVLELRERHERDAATALTRARDAAEAARRDAAALAAARAELAARGRRGRAGRRAGGGAAQPRLPRSTAWTSAWPSAGAAVRAAEGAVGEREGALRAAFRDRRTLDRLRERHQDAWRAGAAAADRQAMDEIALTRFGQSGAASA